MYTPDFSGCYLKLDRAKFHRETIEDRIKTLGKEENLTVLRADQEPNSPYHLFTVQSIPDHEPALADIGVILGDFAHNLRSCLDHLAFQFALFQQDGSVVEEEIVQFPIADDLHRFKSAAGRNLREVHGDHVAFIQSVQPYIDWQVRPYSALGLGLQDLSTPNHHPLHVLRELSNRDKHRIISPVLMFNNMVDLRDRAQYGHIQDPTGRTSFPRIVPLFKPEAGVKVGTKIMRATLYQAEPHMDVAGYIQPTPIVTETGVLFVAVDILEAAVRDVITEAASLPLPTQP